MGMRANPNLANIGPAIKNDALMRLTKLYEASLAFARPALRERRPGPQFTVTPTLSRSSHMVKTSSRPGTHERFTVSPVRSAAAIVGKAAFFAPVTAMRPVNLDPP